MFGRRLLRIIVAPFLIGLAVGALIRNFVTFILELPTILQLLSSLGIGSVLAGLVGELLLRRHVRTQESIKQYFSMLDKVRERSMKYYLPLANAAAGLAATLRKRNGSELQDRIIFAWAVRFHTLSARMINEYMAYFLTSFEAEAIAPELHKRILGHPGFKPYDSSLIAKIVYPETLFIDLTDKIDYGVLSPIFKKFREWLSGIDTTTLRSYLELADAYNELIYYELNLVDKDWYGRIPPRISKASKEKIRETVREMEKEMKEGEERPKLPSYLEYGYLERLRRKFRITYPREATKPADSTSA